MHMTVRDWYCSDHILCNSANYAKCTSRDIEYIVIHYTGNAKDTAQSNGKYFANNSGITASAHVFIDETSVVQSVPFVDRAWHCGGRYYYHSACRNYNAIGIEMCCSGNYRVSETTINRTIDFVAELFKYLGWTSADVQNRVIRHWDVTHKECPAQFAGANNYDWVTFKKQLEERLQVNDEDNNYIDGDEEQMIMYQTVADVPFFAQDAINYMLEKGVIADGSQLNLSEEGLRLAVWNYRLHLLSLENAVVYKTINDVPDYAKEAVNYMVNNKIIADGNQLNLSEEGLRIVIMNYRMHLKALAAK